MGSLVCRAFWPSTPTRGGSTARSARAPGAAARGRPVRLEKAITVPAAEALSAANAADLGRQLKDALRAAGIVPGPTIAAVGRDRVIVKDFKIPRVAAGEEPAVVRFQAGKEMSEAPES